MKFLKKFFQIILSLIGVLIITTLVIIGVDSQRTSYLKVEKNEHANNATYIINNVNIIPMNADTILANKMVYIKDGVIQEIADSINVKHAEIFNAENKYMMPGLIDMHVHVWDRYELGLYLSYGVTAVRNVWGMPMHLRIKEDVNNDEIISPLFFTSGPKLTGPEFIGDDNVNLGDPDEAKEKVISYKENGYDFIKTYYGLDKQIFVAVVEQAEISGVDIVAHPSQKVPYSYHFNPQIKSIEHAEDIVQQPLNYSLDTLKLKEVINDFASSRHSSFCPTLTVYNNIYQMLINDDILSSEQLQLINPLIRKVDSKNQFDRWFHARQEDSTVVRRIFDQHNFHLKIIRNLSEAGVNIICGTGAGIGITIPGRSIHQELAFYKEAGLSNYEVLKTATLNASKTHSIMNQLGTIEEGKIANFLLLDNNPLTKLSALENPSFVFIKGRKLERETLNFYEEKAKNRNNLIASAIRYVENYLVEK